MELDQVVSWMLERQSQEECIYQDEVVDYLLRSDNEEHLRENADGNLSLSTKVLAAFKKETSMNVVWVRSDRYWRYRVDEDEPGREARG